MSVETFTCPKCQTLNEVKISTGHNKPENKGKKYIMCINPACPDKFHWVEGGATTMTTALETVREPVEDYRPNGMLMCNAMNNAVSLVCAGKIELGQIQTYYKIILNALEGRTSDESTT